MRFGAVLYFVQSVYEIGLLQNEQFRISCNFGHCGPRFLCGKTAPETNSKDIAILSTPFARMVHPAGFEPATLA